MKHRNLYRNVNRKITALTLQRNSCITIVSLLLLYLGGVRQAAANSANLFYTNLGNDRYEVTFYYYRMCNGLGYASTYPGKITAPCGTASFTLTRDSIWDVSQTCPKNRTCSSNTASSFGNSIQRYRAILNFRDSAYRKFLGGSCCEVELSVIGRPRGIYTGFNASGNPIKVAATLSLCRRSGLAPGNSSSRQVYNWQVIQFLNQPNYQSLLATDPDGDSLSYELVPCLDGSATGNVSYYPNYGYTNPISNYCASSKPPCTPSPLNNPPRGFYLNPVTGDLVFQPVLNNDISAVGVRINEFRRDSSGKFIRIAYSMVEGYLLTNTTGNNTPIISNPSSIGICEKDLYCFTFTYYDNQNSGQSAPDTPVLRYFTNVGTYTTKITKSPTSNVQTVQVCFTPPAYGSAVKPLYFSVAADDRYCGTSFESRRTHVFTVLPKPVTKLETSVQPGSRYAIKVENADTQSLFEVSLSGPNSYRYQVRNIRSKYMDTLRLFKRGLYYLQVITRRPGYCEIYQYDTVNMTGCLEMTHNARAKAEYCRTQDLSLSVKASNTIGTLSYRWYNRLGKTLSNRDTLRIRLQRDSFLYLRIDDALGCYSLDSFQLRGYVPSAKWTIPTGGICQHNAAPELEAWLQLEPRNKGSWKAAPGILDLKNNLPLFNAELPVRRDTLLPLYFSLQDSLGCRRNDTLLIPVRYTRKLSARDTGLCLGSGSFQMEKLLDGADTSKFRLRWECYNPGSLTADQVHRGSRFIAGTQGTYGFILWNTDINTGCAGRDSFRISMASPPNFNTFTTSALCDNTLGTDVQRYVEVYVPAPKYRWSVLSVNSRPADATQRSALTGATWFLPRQAGLWRLRFEEYSTGCVRSDSISILVQAAPRPYLGTDTSISDGSTLRLNAGNFSAYIWDDGSSSQFRFIPASELSTVPKIYWVQVTDGITQCSGKDTILLSRKAPQGLFPASAERMEVFPNPFGTVLNIRGTELRSCRLLFPDGRTAAVHPAEQGRCTLDTKSLPAGIYILEMRSAEGIRTLRVLRAE